MKQIAWYQCFDILYRLEILNRCVMFRASNDSFLISCVR